MSEKESPVSLEYSVASQIAAEDLEEATFVAEECSSREKQNLCILESPGSLEYSIASQIATEDLEKATFVSEEPSTSEEQNLCILPSNIINLNRLPSWNCERPYNFTSYNFELTKYVINGQTFTSTADVVEEETYIEFEVRERDDKHAIIVDSEDQCCTASDINTEANHSDPSECESDWDEFVNINLEKVKYGYIINDNIFLSNHHWHTIISIDVNLVKCSLCDVCLNIELVEEHIESYMHKKYLKQYQPLKKYGVSITRKISDQYHCGVCNELYISTTDHEASKFHEYNLLYSLNKLSDLHADSAKAKDVYHFVDDRYKMDDYVNDDDSPDYCADEDYEDYIDNEEHNDENDYVYNNNDLFNENSANDEASYANMAKKETKKVETIDIELENRIVKICFDSYNMFLVFGKKNQFYCMACKSTDHISFKLEHSKNDKHVMALSKCPVVEEHEQNYIRKIDDKLYHCGQCNNLHIDIEGHITRYHPKNNRNLHTENIPWETPTDNDNDFGHWSNDRPNVSDDIANGIAIWSNFTTTANTTTIWSNTTQGAKLTTHGSNVTTTVSYNTINGSNDTTNVLNERLVASQNNAAVAPFSNLAGELNGGPISYLNPSIPVLPNLNGVINGCNLSINSSIFGNIVLNPFYKYYTLSLLSYNLIDKVANDPSMYKCVLCNIFCPRYLVPFHMADVEHTKLLLSVPFMPAYQYNLIRTIGELFHCATCDFYSPACHDIIIEHIILYPAHIARFKLALGITDHSITVANLPIPKSVRTLQHEQNTDNVTTNNDNHTTHNDNENQINDETEEINGNIFNETLDSSIEEFDCDEYVFLRLKNSFFKISNASYNSLVHVGDGSRFCFVCSLEVEPTDLWKHVESRHHRDNIEGCKFLETYEQNLMRQMFLTYHCCICNTIIPRKDVTLHLEWPTHVAQYEDTVKVKQSHVNKNKGEIKQIIVSTQKEKIYLNENEPLIKLRLNIKIDNESTDIPPILSQDLPKPTKDIEDLPNPTTSATNIKTETKLPMNATTNLPKSTKDPISKLKMNKIVMFKENALMFPWQHWHGVATVKNGNKCQLCQKTFCDDEVDEHIASEWHNYALETPFETQYAPALFRKISEQILNCMTCNTETANKVFMVIEHVNGKKHKLHYDTILQNSETNSFENCDDDVKVV